MIRRPIAPRTAVRLVDGFTLAVIVSVGIALAGLTWRIVGWAGGDAPVAAAARTAPPPQPAGDADLAPVLALAPFGAPAAGDAVATTLPIELKGIILAVPAARSVALIAQAGTPGPALAYAVGATVPGGGSVDAIAIDHVMLAVAGRRERLAFPRPNAPAAAPAAGPPPPALAQSAPIASGMAPPPGPPPAAAALTASPQALLDSLGASPVTGGYRVGEGLSPPMRAAGLRPGDTILSLNGQPLGNAGADQMLLAAAARSGTATVQVLRGDSRLTLAFPFR